MFKIILISTLITQAVLCAEEPTMLHAQGVEVERNGKTMFIARDIDLRCRAVNFDGKTHWSGNYALNAVPDFCKKSFITTAGKLSPMKMHEKIETFGELEVLEFLEEMSNDHTLALIDSRKAEWFSVRTLPFAYNIPFPYMTEKAKHPKEFKAALTYLGVTSKEGNYDFSTAKTLLLFCNGAWCQQSPQMIEALLDLGYPPEKMKWYRGGLQSWLNLNLTSVVGQASMK